MYFFSRLPQVYHNYRYKQCEGLNIAMFVIAIVANTTYALQFISERSIGVYRGNAMDWADFAAKELPFVIGSLGTLIYDFIIVFQWRYYTRA